VLAKGEKVKTEQINLRLEASLVAAIERAAREESLDRGTLIRRFLETSIKRRQLERALRGYQSGELSLGRAAEEAGVTHWEIQDLARAGGVAYPLEPAEVARRLTVLFERPVPKAIGTQGFRVEQEWMGRRIRTLADVPPKPGGVLLVGVNPAPISVSAAHYYQGRLGKRLWGRLARLGLLMDASPGTEDLAFARAGHGLTDLVKRPTSSADEIPEDELRAGIEQVRQKVDAWRPGLILFPFKQAATVLLGVPSVRPGAGPRFQGVPTFLLSGPYAARREADRNSEELAELLAVPVRRSGADEEETQRITAKDLESGRIRVPRQAKRFFPGERGQIEVVLRGRRLEARYDPRIGPDLERSATIAVGRRALSGLVKEGDVLRVSRGDGGIVHLD
jgi:G:T/U-mismatch repair DNA glycosylase